MPAGYLGGAYLYIYLASSVMCLQVCWGAVRNAPSTFDLTGDLVICKNCSDGRDSGILGGAISRYENVYLKRVVPRL